MKRITMVLRAAVFVLLPLSLMTACSEPQSHIAKINLINDLGAEAELSLCKDDIHCESISGLWPPTKISANETRSFTVSNEETTVFKVSAEIHGKTTARCLRVRRDESRKPSPSLLLSSAADC